MHVQVLGFKYPLFSQVTPEQLAIVATVFNGEVKSAGIVGVEQGFYREKSEWKIKSKFN
jgi:hypothetical protein